LRELHDMIRDDAGDAGDRQLIAIYLGDYVDRGNATREVIDGLVLLQGTEALDWDVITALARDGDYLKPLRVFCCLLQSLGLRDGVIPPGLLRRPGGFAGAEFRRAVAEFQSMFPYVPPLLAVLRREWLLCTEPRVGAHDFALRLRGIFSPGSGLPAGISPETGLPHVP